VITNTFSEKFQAVWKHIEDHLPTLSDVHQLREFYSIAPENVSHKKNNTLFIISQPSVFLLDAQLHIYGQVVLTQQVNKNEHNEGREIDTVRITLYSYTASIVQLRRWLDDLHETYRTVIEGHRSGKQYIYTLFPAGVAATTAADPLSCWKETVFDTTRQFSNLFFQEKEAILNKIDFFLQNRDWYYEYGIPYTLGIGLYGKPGTGKTSFIKCLAKYTGRHVILLSFKHIRTKKQLEDCFYESQYHVGNEEGSIGFDKKILVMEDIDCIGDIVLDRSRHTQAPCLPETQKLYQEDTLVQQHHPQRSTCLLTCRKSDFESNRKKTDPQHGSKEETIPLEECLTLDDILNVLDGIRETPGRILVITSNHYDRLDPALVRPGRIDLTLPMTHASHTTLRQMYAHFFKMPMHESVFLAENMSAEFKFSPAELVNMYLNSNGDPDLFLSLLMT
jgi:hypothetical protein